MTSTSIPCAVLSLLILASHSQKSNAVDLIANGGFETGTFAGWTVASDFSSTSYDNNVTPPASGVYVQANSLTTPVSGLSTIGPATGNFYALGDSTTAGANVLIQNFTVPLGTTGLELSFDMFTYDWYGAGAVGSSLNFQDNPNQHVRVDLLTASSPDFDTSGPFVVVNIFDGLQTQNDVDPPAWQNYTFDLLPYVTGGATYRLRFGAVDNQFVLNMGIDNVSVVAVPEPSTLLLGSLASLAIYVRTARGRHATVRTFLS